MLEITRPRIILGLPSYDQQSHDQRWVAVISA